MLTRTWVFKVSPHKSFGRVSQFEGTFSSTKTSLFQLSNVEPFVPFTAASDHKNDVRQLTLIDIINTKIMEASSYWLDTSILLSEDFDLIQNTLKSLNLDRERLQKKSEYYLSKAFTSDKDIKWGPVASKILVFYATLIPQDQENLVMFFLSSPDKWLERIDKFRRAYQKRSQVTRDCVFQLFKTHVLSITDIAQQPTMLAQLAHRMDVHEYMALRIEGKSPVSYCLRREEKRAVVHKKLRLNFFKSLHQAFKSDFTHIIRPSIAEFSDLILGRFKRIFQFLEQIDAKFVALDYALSIFKPVDGEYDIIEEIRRDYYKPRKPFWPKRARGLAKVIFAAVRDETELYCGRFPKVLRGLHSQANLLELAYHRTFKTYALQGIVTPHAEFPVHNLPVEIIEHIITIDEEMMETIRPLFCVSRQMNAIKGKIKWAKHKSLLKCKTVEQSLAAHQKDFDWGRYYFELNRYDSNWINGKYRKHTHLLGYAKDMNEEIAVFRLNTTDTPRDNSAMKWHNVGDVDPYRPNCYWFRLADLKDYKPLDLYCLSNYEGGSIGIIDSDPFSPRFAVAKLNVVDFYEGMNKIASCPYEGPSASSEILCKGDRVFQAYTEIILDDRLTCKRIFENGYGYVTDMNVLNGQRICVEPNGLRNSTKLCLRSKDHETIGDLYGGDGDMFFYANKHCVFLDEFCIVVTYRDNLISGYQRHHFANFVGYFDTRKLGEISDSFAVSELVHFDAPNRRAVGAANEKSGVMHLYDLNSKRLLGALRTGNRSSGAPMLTSRFLYHRELLDFGI